MLRPSRSQLDIGGMTSRAKKKLNGQNPASPRRKQLPTLIWGSGGCRAACQKVTCERRFTISSVNSRTLQYHTMQCNALQGNTTQCNARGERGQGRQIQNQHNKTNPSTRLNLNQASYQTHPQKQAGEPADSLSPSDSQVTTKMNHNRGTVVLPAVWD